MLPSKLKDFNLFGDGESFQGQVEEITLPGLTRKVEEYRAGGMDGPVEIDLGQELIEFGWTAGGWLRSIWQHYAAASHDAGQLRFRGSYESDEDGNGHAVEIVIRGRHKGINLGTAKGGDSNTVEVSTSCSYYKLTVDDEDVLEIDLPGCVLKVNGEDRLAERRRRLGI